MEVADQAADRGKSLLESAARRLKNAALLRGPVCQEEYQSITQTHLSNPGNLRRIRLDGLVGLENVERMYKDAERPNAFDCRSSTDH